MLLSVRLIIAILGLSLPGYLFARVLRLKASWAAAFPLSALLMVELIVGFSAMSIPVRFNTVAAFLCGWTVLNIVLLLFRNTLTNDSVSTDYPDLPAWLAGGCLGVAFLIVLVVTFRATFYPLSGYDTFFRWEALARQMLLRESLNFYPPVSADDYSIYLIPDGIPPLVATIYWWLYAAIGKPLEQVTSVSVMLQLASAMALTFYATFSAFGSRAAYFSLLAFSTSTLLINGFAIGQETGYTAISVAGQFCFAWATVRRPRVSTVIAAALFAAMGALARDYGPALVLAGFLVLAWHRQTRRYLLLFTTVMVLFSAPWYLRNWAITGNFLYPHAIPGGFPINDVFAATQNPWKDIFAFYQYDISQWMVLLGVLTVGAPLAILLGTPYGIIRWRDSAPMLITVGLVVFLWLLSMGETAGGPIYSMRALNPVFVTLTILAGEAGARLYGHTVLSSRLRAAAMVAVVICSTYAVISSASHPFPPEEFFTALTSTHTGPPEFCAVKQELAGRLQKSDLPTTGVLTDSAYLGTILQRETRFRPVMIWSPEVKFVFDKGLPLDEIRRRLMANNIRVVSLADNWGNNRVLSNYPFYQEFIQKKEPDGFKLFTVLDMEVLYVLMPM